MSEWDQDALRRLRAKLADSDTFLALFTEAYKTDPTCLLQLGYAMMMEKPIILLVPEGTSVPRPLRRIADHIATFRASEDLALVAERALKTLEEGPHGR